MPDENERKILLKSRNDNVFVKERNSSEGEAGNNRTKDIEKKELIESIHDQNGKNELNNKTPEQNTNDIIELGVEDEEKELSETQMEKQTDENVIALGIEDDNGDTEDDMDIEVDVQDLQNVQNVQNVQDLQKLSEDKSQKNGGNSTRFGDALIAYLDGNSF
jgi:Fe-S cluster assembly scaffold protein SufB